MGHITKDILMHYGMPRRSGRYPYGSGEDPYQHSGDFLSRVDQLRSENFTFTDKDGKTYTGDTAIAKSMKLSTTQFRTQVSLANDERRALAVETAKSLREKGYNNTEIARKMGYNNESSVRSLLKESSESRMNQARVTADFIKKEIDEKGMIDIGAGVERELNVSREKLNQAIEILRLEGYPTYGGRIEQVTNRGKWTTLRVIGPPGTENKDIYNLENVHSLRNYITHDDGETYDPKWVYPKSMDSSRLKIRYAEEGGINKDGVVEIRRGVKDLSLGESRYAQVRILVDGSHYIKGMAVYSDGSDMPDGVDVIFNTNKSKGTPKLKVLKPIKEDPENPFGSLIKEGVVDPDKPDNKGGQSYYYDENGKKQLSLINKRAEEGDWIEWSNKLPSQFLSKQSQQLINKQLNLAAADKQDEFDEICSLTNPTVKKVLLQSFSDDCDSAAVHLQAAALPRQEYKVILPLPSLKDNEIYAPHCKPGETVALIRYPHGGTFEIPILTVNNKNPEGREILGNTPTDAVGINSKVAERLSGADFDGDTVMVIPTNSKVKITSTPPLRDLEGFDPKMEYGPDKNEPCKVIDKDGKVWIGAEAEGKKGQEFYERNGHMYSKMINTQTEMGKISNLITDMTLRGAKEEELARAVKHSMVVIDAEKHHLDYKQSERDNNISALKKAYQGTVDENGRYHEGASTLISRAKSETQVLKRTGSPKINQKGKPWYDPNKPDGALIYESAHKNEKGKEWYDPNKPEGAVVYKTVPETYIDKNGKVKQRTQSSTKMADTSDARTLISDADTPQERAYADYANKMKSLANQARNELILTDRIKVSQSAKETYKNEVNSLNAKLNGALMNAPRERQAQMMANVIVEAKRKEYPDMTKAEIKKESQRALVQCRALVGAKRNPIEIDDREWEAIQAGAISESQLIKILNNTDIDEIRQRATPKATTTLSSAKVNHIATLNASGYTTSEIAEKLNVSTSTVSKYLNGRK